MAEFLHLLRDEACRQHILCFFTVVDSTLRVLNMLFCTDAHKIQKKTFRIQYVHWKEDFIKNISLFHFGNPAGLFCVRFLICVVTTARVTPCMSDTNSLTRNPVWNDFGRTCRSVCGTNNNMGTVFWMFSLLAFPVLESAKILTVSLIGE